MDIDSVHSPSEKRSAEDRLDSWKEIANYLKRDVRTVQRWEKEEGLPVLRHVHHSRSTVFAYQEDLDKWLDAQSNTSTASLRVGLLEGKRVLVSVVVFVFLAVALSLVYFEEGLHFLHLSSITGRPTPVPLTTYMGHEMHPSLSPLGDFVAYSWDRGTGENDDIYVGQIGSLKHLQRTTHPASDYSPCWSPDGALIAFLRLINPEVSQVVLMPPLAGVERVLTSVQAPPLKWGPQLAWSPDGKWLVTASKKSLEDTFGLYRIEVSSGRGQFITDPLGDLLGDHSPAFSPDGGFLAFVRNVGLEVSDVHIVGFGPATGNRQEPVRVSNLSAEVFAPTWTVSGRKILFTAGPWPNAQLWRIDPLPSAIPERLQLAGEAVYFPRITSRHHLVFSRVSVQANIWFVDLKSHERTKALFSSSGFESRPEFSPDGSRVVFSSDRSGSSELWLSDGERARQLTGLSSSHTGDVAWSPDGKLLVFDSTIAGNTDIFVLPVEIDAPGLHWRVRIHYTFRG